MGLFTALGPAAADEVASAFGLGGVRNVQGIPQGTVNSNYRLSADRGEFFVRINEGKAEASVAFEARLLEHIAARGVLTPAPERCRGTGLGYAGLAVGWVTVFPWVAGGHRSLRTRGRGELRALGQALGALHIAGDRLSELPASRYSFDALTDVLATLGPEMDAQGLVGRDELDRAFAALTKTRAAALGLPAGLIHGDLFPDNVLFAPGEPRIAALLDFEQASAGTFVYDLAVCLGSWCFGTAYEAEPTRALVAGYRDARPLSLGEMAALYDESRLVAARFALTRVRDVALNPGASEWVRTHKDYRRYLARSSALDAMGASGFRSLIGA